MQILLKSASPFMRYHEDKKLSISLWPWKLGQGHQNLISYWSGPNNIDMQIWYILANGSWDNMQTSAFWLKFGNLSPAVTQKLGQGHQNLNSTSSCTVIHANLVKICQWFHEISCRQETVNLTVTLKIRSRSPKYIISYGSCLNNTNMQIW